MVNIVDFINRLKEIIQHHQLSASQFADSIGVQRSSISHILSGRNKPSLDFILKVTNTYTDVDIYWLLNGKGSFPKSSSSPTIAGNSPALSSTNNNPESVNHKKISRILICFDDGTFDEYLKESPHEL
ncbi:MAG: helix-turn-helix domain-containing protein [Flavobacteriales bacterium]|nr:helix-turn-helix domain-containing protein [Flavobacteriales bacterium]